MPLTNNPWVQGGKDLLKMYDNQAELTENTVVSLFNYTNKMLSGLSSVTLGRIGFSSHFRGLSKLL